MTCRARDGVVRCEALLFVAMRTHTTQYNTTINKNSVNAIKAGIDRRDTKISTTNMNNTQLTQPTNNQLDEHERYVSFKMLCLRIPHKSFTCVSLTTQKANNMSTVASVSKDIVSPEKNSDGDARECVFITPHKSFRH